MDNKLDNKMNKEDSYRILEMVNSWIHAADNKASILLAFIAIFIGLTFSVINEIKGIITNLAGFWFVFMIILMFICGFIYIFLIVSVFFNLVNVFIARINHADIYIENNLLSFISISRLETKEYVKLVEKSDSNSINEMILEQININSKIANIKLVYFNKSLKLSIILVLITLFIIFLTNILS